MDVMVIGGGVAGAATAVALRRIGADVTVHEAYADPAGRVGSFLSLSSNGLRGLRAIGCLEEVQRAGFPVATQRMWASSGRLLGENPRGRLSDDPLRSTTLMRGALVETLREAALRAGARTVTGSRLVGASPDGDGVRAEFADGSSARADLLVGADGLWSVTRSLLDPGAPAPAYAGLYSVSGVADPEAVGGPTIEPGVFNMVLGRAGAFAHVLTAGGELWWCAQVTAPTRPEPDGLDDLDDRAWKARLTEAYRFESAPREIVRAATEVHRPTLMHTMAEVPVRHSDRLVLVGDAVHPVGAGQGASMAIEDAVVLARALDRAGSVEAALADFDRIRRPRIRKMAEAAGDNRALKTSGPVRRRLNELTMPFFFRHFYERSTAWLYTHDLGALPAPAPASASAPALAPDSR